MDRCAAGFRPDLCRVRVNRDRGGRSHARVHVRFAPKADNSQTISSGPLSAKTGREQLQHMPCAEGRVIRSPRRQARADSVEFRFRGSLPSSD
jgi:hypothetical protein